MATIYRSNEHIAELKLTVRGAATILLFDPNEVEGLQALCISIGQNQRGPTESIFNLLTHERDIDLIGARNRLADIRIRNWQDVAASEFANDPVQEIVAALGLTAAVWRSQGEDVSDLVLILCACDPHAKPEPVMHLEGENPGWILYKGSVRATLFVSAFTAGGFVVGIFTRGIGVERRARNVVEDLRTKQLERIPRVKVLPRIDQLKPSDIANKCGVILFLHGLLSTDLGTFDVLTDVLRDQG